MSNIPFFGAATALVTPFSGGKVDYPALERLIYRQLEAGISALVVCGTTGEAPTLSEAEKKEIVAFTVSLCRGHTAVVAGCGSPSTDYAARLAENAREAGADAILTVTPYYNKCSSEGLYLHYREVARRARLPVIAYNVPSRTGMSISAIDYERLSAIDELVAVKEASGSIAEAQKAMHRFGDRFAFYSGCDELTAPLISLGAVGCISVVSNLLPGKTVQLCNSKSLADAARLSRELYGITRTLFDEVNPIPVKAALSMLGLCSDEMRLPLCRACPDTLRSLEAQLSEHGLL